MSFHRLLYSIDRRTSCENYEKYDSGFVVTSLHRLQSSEIFYPLNLGLK